MTNAQRATEHAQITRQIEELEQQIAHPSPPGTHKVRLTVNRDGHTVHEWVDMPDDMQPTPANRPIQEPIRTPRTTSNPSHTTWTPMDRRTKYRTGCAWHTCPNCTTYSIVEMSAKVEVNEETGKRYTTLVETHKPAGTIQTPKPVTGMNLFRYHFDGHEECNDCGWKGEPKVNEPVKPKGMKNVGHAVYPEIDRKEMLRKFIANQQGK